MDYVKIQIKDYKDYPQNYNGHPDKQIEELKDSIKKFGQARNVVVWQGYFLAGHGFKRAALELGITEIEAKDYSDIWDEDKAREYMIADNRTARMSEEDNEILADLLSEMEDPLEVPGVDDDLLEALLADYGDDWDGEGGGDGEKREESPPKIDLAEELLEKWGVKAGDIFEVEADGVLHRIVCGDCTKNEFVEALMGKEKAVLSHDDPPYGMGKEKDGVVNDNLYREKLDEFQMSWWNTKRRYLEDNASAYIWGNAEDLWRLWYVGGLKDSERLTLRNEIVWNKEHGQGMGAEDFRSFAPATERCLFFMLGEQGFNNNADNYWNGWDSVRLYLKNERDKMKWSNKFVADIFGFHPRMASHWFDESQWSFIRQEQYQRLQTTANGKAFKREYDDLKREYDDLKREYDDLKREFYSTRAYFNNTHDLMTDVWSYQRVTGDERHGHATPKPVAMIERIIKSSSRENDIVLECFSGSGSTLIACHQTRRQARVMEIEPKYVAVSLQRIEDLTGVKPRLVGNIYLG